MKVSGYSKNPLWQDSFLKDMPFLSLTERKLADRPPLLLTFQALEACRIFYLALHHAPTCQSIHSQPFQPLWHQCYPQDRKSTRLNSSHVKISYAVFCL